METFDVYRLTSANAHASINDITLYANLHLLHFHGLRCASSEAVYFFEIEFQVVWVYEWSNT